MSTAPAWLNDTLTDFGRQMGLNHLAFNDRGAAALRFENGLRLAFEYAPGILTISIQLPMQSSRRSLQMLLAQAHPMAGAGLRIRAFYLEHSEHGAIAVAVPEGQVTVNVIETIFRSLWERGEYLRRNI